MVNELSSIYNVIKKSSIVSNLRFCLKIISCLQDELKITILQSLSFFLFPFSASVLTYLNCLVHHRETVSPAREVLGEKLTVRIHRLIVKHYDD